MEEASLVPKRTIRSGPDGSIPAQARPDSKAAPGTCMSGPLTRCALTVSQSGFVGVHSVRLLRQDRGISQSGVPFAHTREMQGLGLLQLFTVRKSSSARLGSLASPRPTSHEHSLHPARCACARCTPYAPVRTAMRGARSAPQVSEQPCQEQAPDVAAVAPRPRPRHGAGHGRDTLESPRRRRTAERSSRPAPDHDGRSEPASR